MSTIVTRLGKGSPLTITEMDANLTNLNTDKLEATTAATTYVSQSSPTMSGDVNITGFTRRIRADFGNVLISLKAMFQASGTNESTVLSAIPNGAGSSSSLYLSNSSDVSATSPASIAYLQASSSVVDLGSTRWTASGTYLPMTISVNNVEQARFPVAGGMNIGGGALSNIGILDVYGTAGIAVRNAAGSGAILTLKANGAGLGVTASSTFSSGGYGPFTVQTSAIDRLQVTSAGDIINISTGGIGYGTGSGTTGTQATSRTTSVALAAVRSTGSITLFTAAPTVGTWVTFGVTGGGWAATDTIEVSIKSATNTYVAAVSAVGAGTCSISIVSISGTASDTPVINFAVVKGAVA